MNLPVYCILDRPACGQVRMSQPDKFYFYVYDMDTLRHDVRSELAHAMTEGYSYRGLSRGYDSEIGDYVSYEYGRGRASRWFIVPVAAIS